MISKELKYSYSAHARETRYTCKCWPDMPLGYNTNYTLPHLPYIAVKQSICGIGNMLAEYIVIGEPS